MPIERERERDRETETERETESKKKREKKEEIVKNRMRIKKFQSYEINQQQLGLGPNSFKQL